VWHLQIIPVMLSFLVVAAVLVASIHRGKGCVAN
jgi:hypothetical protein